MTVRIFFKRIFWGKTEVDRTEISADLPKYRQNALFLRLIKKPIAVKKSFSIGELALRSDRFLNRQADCLLSGDKTD